MNVLIYDINPSDCEDSSVDFGEYAVRPHSNYFQAHSDTEW